VNDLISLYLAHQGKVSDKWSSYLTAYDRLFNEQRDKPVRLLEIGIQNGGSLEIWSRYFCNASALIGCDINPDCAGLSYDDPRISLIVGDANNPEVSEQVFQRSPQFDIIIDDGSHRSSDIIKSFALYFPRLVEGGVYVAEDLHCSYWADYEGGLLYPYSSIAFFKRLADVINYEHWGITKERSEVLRGVFTKYGCEIDIEVLSQVHSIEFINSLCVVRKKSSASNNLGRRVITGSIELVAPDILKLNDSLLPVCGQSSNPWAVRNPPPDEAIENTELLLADARQQIADQNHAVTERDGQIASLQQSILEREHAFTQQLAALQAEEQRRVSETQQTYTAREEQQRQDAANLQQQLESQRAQAQEREDQLIQQAVLQVQAAQAAAAMQAEQLQGQIMALQHELLERERAFTQQWTTWQAEEQQRISETQQSHAAREAQLREDARAHIDTLRASMNHQVVFGQALAERLAALQSTWWWRLSMPWRRSSKWLDIASSVLPPTYCETPQPQEAPSKLTSGLPPTTPEKQG